jgi:diguanylate cyclase (GGDEF)-like protein/PAS domain S-box-containing protein
VKAARNAMSVYVTARRGAFMVALGIVAFFVSVRFELFELLLRATRRYEAWQLDEILTVGIFVVVFLAFFYWRSLRKSEERLRLGEKRFRTLIEGAADAIFMINASGEIFDANRRACESLGYSRQELAGLRVEDIEVENFSDGWRLAGETVEGVHRRKDGTTFPVEIRSEAFEMDGEKVFMSIVRDVGEWRRMIEDMKTTGSRNRALLDAIPDLVFRLDRDGEVLDVKANEYGRLRIPPRGIVGSNLRDVVPEDISASVLRAAREAMDSGRIEAIEIDFPLGAGELHFEVRIVASGADEAVCFARDITERKESEARNLAVLRSIPDAVCRISRRGDYLDVWAGESRKLYKPKDVVLGGDVRSILGDEVADEFLPLVERAIETGEIQTLEYALSSPEGDFEIEARIVGSGEDEAIYFARDVTERNEAVRRLEESEARNRAMLEAIPDAVFRFGRDGEYLDAHVSENFRPFAEGRRISGNTVREFLPPHVAEEFMRRIPEVLDTGEMREFEYGVTVGDKDFHREARMVKSGEGEVTCFVRDIGERVEFESRIKRLAYRDDLTDLPNRAAFMERLAEVCAGDAERAAVVILSLRGFEKINDSLGREAGDRLLSIVAWHMEDFFGGMGEVARFGGDEFAMLLRGFEDFDEVLSLIERGQQIYPRMPFLLDEMEVFLRPDVGVARFEAGDAPEEVVRKASVALLEAKADSDSDYKVYDASMGERAVARLRLERDLRLALEYGQLEVHYQPEVFLSSGRIYSLEALARWNHPEHGPIGPNEFIPLAEESGLIIRLGEYVLEEACRRMRMWREALGESAPCSVSVNISALQLRQRDLVPSIVRVLESNGLEPERLQIEITESAAMEDIESCRRIFGELGELGVRVALDDFGTGYSSLSCLRQFPLDALKVDRSFVSTLEGDAQMANVVGSIIELAHALELVVISEGIETPGQLSTLRRLGSDIGQGYHFSRPVPPEEALDLLASWQTLNLLRGSG